MARVVTMIPDPGILLNVDMALVFLVSQKSLIYAGNRATRGVQTMSERTSASQGSCLGMDNLILTATVGM